VEVTIERIETAGPDSRARRLVFDDGSDARMTAAVVVRELGLEPGSRADHDALEAALTAAERRSAKERALRILSARERSAHEVRQRLADDGYPLAIRTAIVERLCELGLIDDERFARLWARSRFAAGYGSRRVLQELAKRGIEADTAQAAVDEAADQADELTRAIAALRGRDSSNRRERERLIRRLVSRGFELRVAIQAVDHSESPHDS